MNSQLGCYSSHWCILGSIADKQFRLLRSMLPFRGLSVCLSVMFVHYTQTTEDIDTISFAYVSPMFLPDRIKNQSTPSSRNFAQNWHTPCWFERWRHLIANCGRMVWDSAVVTGHNAEPIGNHCRSFEWYHVWPGRPPYEGPVMACV